MIKYRPILQIANHSPPDVPGGHIQVRIMKILIKLVCTFSIFFAAQSGFACDYPERVSIPNGGTASKDDMLEGQKGVKDYVASMEVYLECLVDEEKAAIASMEGITPEEEQQRTDAMNKKYNAAVDEMERVAAQFNAEVQAYKAKDSG